MHSIWCPCSYLAKFIRKETIILRRNSLIWFNAWIYASFGCFFMHHRIESTKLGYPMMTNAKERGGLGTLDLESQNTCFA